MSTFLLRVLFCFSFYRRLFTQVLGPYALHLTVINKCLLIYIESSHLYRCLQRTSVELEGKDLLRDRYVPL